MNPRIQFYISPGIYRGHKLLQAIARVNRIYPDKEFGYIIDYYGVIENLDDALEMYSSFEDFDNDDLDRNTNQHQ